MFDSANRIPIITDSIGWLIRKESISKQSQLDVEPIAGHRTESSKERRFLLRIREKYRDGHPELFNQHVNGVQREVPLTPFDTREVSGGYSEVLSEALLRQFTRMPNRTYLST